MKISELINILSTIKTRRGDLVLATGDNLQLREITNVLMFDTSQNLDAVYGPDHKLDKYVILSTFKQEEAQGAK